MSLGDVRDPQPANRSRKPHDGSPKNRWSYLATAAITVLGSLGVALTNLRSSDVVECTPPAGLIHCYSTVLPISTVPTSTTDPAVPSHTAVPDGPPSIAEPTEPLPTTTSVFTPKPIPTEVPETEPGWCVIGVASDDVLNVRQSPTASSTVVGTLAYNAYD
jgi:hypothetical protein